VPSVDWLSTLGNLNRERARVTTRVMVRAERSFLEMVLKDGVWMPTKEIFAAADAYGIKKSALERAKEGLSRSPSRNAEGGPGSLRPPVRR
jgi:hypothetical protein